MQAVDSSCLFKYVHKEFGVIDKTHCLKKQPVFVYGGHGSNYPEPFPRRVGNI